MGSDEMGGEGSSPLDDVAAAPSHVRWLMLAGVWMVYAGFGITVVGLAPLVTPIVRDLGMSHAEMGLVLGGWQLIYIVSAVPCGAMLDRLGARRGLLLAALLIGGSGVARAFATDVTTLFMAVALFGIGGPILSSGAPKVVAKWFTGGKRGLAMGIYMTGPAIGSVLVLSFTNSAVMPLFENDWRAVLRLWGYLALGSGVFWLILSSHPAARAVERGSLAKPRQPRLAEIKALLGIPAVRLMLVMSVAIFTFNHGLNNWLPELLRAGGMTAAKAGYWAAVPTMVGIAGALAIPCFATPERRFRILFGLAILAALASIALHSVEQPWLGLGLVCQGLARSSMMTIAVLALVETKGVGDERAGVAGGLFFAAAEVGGASGPAVLGALYDVTGGFDAGLHLLTVVTLSLAVGALWLQRLVRHSEH